MPRRTRTQALRARGVYEETARRDREEGYRRLEIWLRRAWREGRNPLAAETVQVEVQPTTYASMDEVPSDAAL